MSSRTTSGSTSWACAISAYESVKQPPSVRLADEVARVMHRVLPESLLRLAYRVGYLVFSAWWWITCPVAAGSKVVVTRGDELLFIRQTYGVRRRWDLPGGNAAAGESPREAAGRELLEEVGLTGEMQPLGTWTSSGRGRRGTVHAFQIEVSADAELEIDRAEIAEARWFSRTDLPAPLARGTDAILRAWTDASPRGRHGTSQ